VATLHYGPGAALCGLTGAEAGGLRGFETDQVHVIVPKQSTIKRLATARLHESRRYDPERDQHSHATPPRTRLERSVIDAAAWSPNPRRACTILAAAVQQRLTTADRLRSELLLAGQVRHRRLLLSVLGDIRAGSQTLGEIDLAAFCRRHRLPQPARQAMRKDSTGRMRFLDAEWELPDGRIVVAEIDGVGHLRFDTWLDDMARANELALTRRIVLRIPNLAFRLDGHTVADQLRRALSS
jgi:hypothetical protein